MARTYSILMTVSLTATLLFVVCGHAGESRKPSGGVVFAGTVAVPSSGPGVTWGKGTLLLNKGTQHAFEVHGLGVRSRSEAIASVEAVGEVFNLKKLSDFEGTYKATQPEVTAGRGAIASRWSTSMAWSCR